MFDMQKLFEFENNITLKDTQSIKKITKIWPNIEKINFKFETASS